MLTLNIQDKSQIVTTRDGASATTYRVDATYAGKRQDLHDLPRLFDLEGVKIVKGRKKKSTLITLPPHVELAVRKYLDCYHAREDHSFDCLSLANLVVGLPTYPKHLLWRFWNTNPIKFGPLQHQRVLPGNIIFFMSGNVFHHAAINISDDTYVSVWGAGGDLEFTSLKMMERAFGAQQVVRATARE